MSIDIGNILEGLPQRTKQFVEAIGLPQRDIAKNIGVSQSFFSEVSNGKTRFPSIPMLLGLRYVYSISLDWYLLGIGPMFEKHSEVQMVAEPEGFTYKAEPAKPELSRLADQVVASGDPVLVARAESYLQGMLDSARVER